MASPQPNWIHEVADELAAEILQVAEAVALELAPPPRAHDGRQITRRQYLEHAREMSLRDPTYVQRDYDAMAPVVMTLPGLGPVRSPTGVRNFTEKWKEARPDLFAAAVLEQTPPGGA